jgi:hypothetical protein
MLAHGLIEGLLAGVTKWRMANVVYERQRLSEVHIQLQLLGNGPRNLRHFDGMREPVAEVIADALGENLGFVFEAAEGARVNDTVAIALKVVAIGVRWFRKASAARAFDPHGIIGEHRASVANRVLADEKKKGEIVAYCAQDFLQEDSRGNFRATWQ